MHPSDATIRVRSAREEPPRKCLYCLVGVPRCTCPPPTTSKVNTNLPQNRPSESQPLNPEQPSTRPTFVEWARRTMNRYSDRVGNGILSVVANVNGNGNVSANNPRPQDDRPPMVAQLPPLVLKNCRSIRVGKCCEADLYNLRLEDVLEYVRHWDEHVAQIIAHAELHGSDFSFKLVLLEIFDEPLNRRILTNVPMRSLTGIINPAKECFAIAILQGLVACPPFLHFVANKSPVSNLDYYVRGFMAQYLTRFRHIHISSILYEVLPDYVVQTQDDAKYFYENFSHEYFDDKLARVKSSIRFKCTYCEAITNCNANDSYITLNWPDDDRDTPTDITEMIDVTRRAKYVTMNCDKCVCTIFKNTTMYKFSDILCVDVCPYYYDKSKTDKCGYQDGSPLEQFRLRQSPIEFHEIQDFGPLSNSELPQLYNLAAVVYYDGNIESGTGHYTTRVFHKGYSYIADDKYVSSETIVNGEPQKMNGVPCFIIYYKTELENLSNTDKALQRPVAPTKEKGKKQKEEEEEFDPLQPGPSKR
ncbi:unnamed protein product [Caenorhabditis sp. 36 PRJEB53466]|nr:unnamed protein product [Caenorhabditis sp. 36 PRJEB53466]